MENRGLKMSDIKVGMRLRSVQAFSSAYSPLTVIKAENSVFKYKLDNPVFLDSKEIFSEGLWHGADGYSYFEEIPEEKKPELKDMLLSDVKVGMKVTSEAFGVTGLVTRVEYDNVQFEINGQVFIHYIPLKSTIPFYEVAGDKRKEKKPEPKDLGDDPDKWAEAFCDKHKKYDFKEVDKQNLSTWFSMAIESAHLTRYKRSLPPVTPSTKGL